MSGVKDYQLNIKTYLITILDDMNNIIKELNDDDTSREDLLDIEVTIENESLDKLTHINNIIEYINQYIVYLLSRENPLTNEEYVYILEFLYIFYKYIVPDIESSNKKMDKLIDLFDKDDITLPKLEIIIDTIRIPKILDIPKNKFINDLVSNFRMNKLEKITPINYHDYIEKKIKLIDLLNILSSKIKSQPVTQSVTQPVENYQTYDYNSDYIENIISILKSIKGYILQYLVNNMDKGNENIINDLNNFMRHDITHNINENIKNIINTYGLIEENIKTSKTNVTLYDSYNILDKNLNNILEAYIGNKYINISENEEELKLVYIIPEPIQQEKNQPPSTVPSVVQPPPTLPSVVQQRQSKELIPNKLSLIKKSNKYEPKLNSIKQQQGNQQGNYQGNYQPIIKSENPVILNLQETKPMPHNTNLIEPNNTEPNKNENQPLNIQPAPAAQLPQQQQQQQQQQQPNTPNQIAGNLSKFIEEIKKINPVPVDLLEFIESNKSKPDIDIILRTELINELNELINEYNQNSEDFIENIKDFELFGINFESNINKFIECINSTKEYNKDIKIYKEKIKNVQKEIDELKQPIKEEYDIGPKPSGNGYVSSKTDKLEKLERQKLILENKIKGANMKIDLLKKTDSSKKKISITDIENCYTNEKDKLYNYLITYIKSNIDSEKNKQTDNIRKHVEKIYNYMQKSNIQELKIKELIKKIKNIIEIIIVYIKIFNEKEIFSNINTSQIIYDYLQSIIKHFKEHNITVLSLLENFDNFDIYYETYIKQFEKIITTITEAKSKIFKFLEDLNIEIALSCPKTPTCIDSSKYSTEYKKYLGDLLKQEYFITNCCDDKIITNISNKQKNKIDECNKLDTCYYNYDEAKCKHTEAFKKYLETQKELYDSNQKLYDKYNEKYKKLIEIKNLLEKNNDPEINKIYIKLVNILKPIKPNDEVILKHLNISNKKNILHDILMYYNELYDKYKNDKKNEDKLKNYINILSNIFNIYYMDSSLQKTLTNITENNNIDDKLNKLVELVLRIKNTENQRNQKIYLQNYKFNNDNKKFFPKRIILKK